MFVSVDIFQDSVSMDQVVTVCSHVTVEIRPDVVQTVAMIVRRGDLIINGKDPIVR